MTGRTNAGSGSGFAEAAVSVTYPAGSLCVAHHPASNISITDYKKSGKKLFLLPKTGSWDFTISNDDGQRNEETLDVEEYDAKVFTITYWNGELFDNGNEFVDITGGWDVFYPRGSANYNSSHVTAEKTNGSLHLKVTNTRGSDQWYTGGLIMHNSIDLSQYSKLHAQVSYISVDPNGTGSSGISIAPILDSSHSGDFWSSSLNLVTKVGTTGEYIVDISDWSTGQIAFIASTRDPSAYNEVRISKIWLSR